MKEYGGFIGLDTYRLPMLHEGAVALNCGRNCLAYLIRSKNIKKLVLPFYMCNSIFNVCSKYGVETVCYHVGESLLPEDIDLEDGAWLYVANYYGQLTREKILELKAKYDRIIIDNSQAYFDAPVEGVDTYYTCRKYFGVADGAFLYTDKLSDEEYPLDESFERMRFLLGRYERSASEFYDDYKANNRLFVNEPIKRMSKLTCNLLHGIDYNYVKQRRTDNFISYHTIFGKINKLELRISEGALVYPLLIENGPEIRRALQKKNIYVPTFWPAVLERVSEDSSDRYIVDNILPLPCDQRYQTEDTEYIAECLNEIIA